MSKNDLPNDVCARKPWKGQRIHERLERFFLGEDVINELLILHSSNSNFCPEAIAARSWKAIDAPDNGGLLGDEIGLIVEYAHSIGVDTLYATSKIELDRAKDGRVLLARIKEFTAHDLSVLQNGDWLLRPFVSELQQKDLCWLSWEESILFTLPLRFAIIRLIDSYGHTTIAGEAELIDTIKSYSGKLPQPDDVDALLSTRDFFKKLSPQEAQSYRAELLQEPCYCEWVDWPLNQV